MKTFLTLGFILAAGNLMAASYEVPVAAELKELAIFELQDFEKKTEGDKVVVKYKLPYVLVGNEEKIKLEGKAVSGAEELLLVGDKAVATCRSYDKFVCTIEYNDLDIDQEAAASAIRAISKNPTEVSGRLEVMRAFSTDPVGIITY